VLEFQKQKNNKMMQNLICAHNHCNHNQVFHDPSTWCRHNRSVVSTI